MSQDEQKVSDLIDGGLIEKNKIINTVVGEIHISHTVRCPHCNYNHDDYYDIDWWHNQITHEMPSEESYRETYEVRCAKCEKEFTINHFEY